MKAVTSRISRTALVRAERSGLRLAVLCRTIVIVVGLAWYSSWSLRPDFDIRWMTVGVLVSLAALGLVYLWLIGARRDRPWMKFAIFATDAAVICALWAVVPVSRAHDVPQIIAFRVFGIHYLLPLLALATLTLSWRLVLWTGAAIAACRLAAFWWVAASMDRRMSWDDLPDNATVGDYVNTFLSVDFVGYGTRASEAGLMLIGAVILALGVWRARRVFVRRIVGMREREAARRERDDTRSALGAYVPETLADRIVEERGLIAPQTLEAAILVVDLEGFTPYARGREPQEVIATLDRTLGAMGDAVTGEAGVVVTHTGDGLVAAFGVPARLDAPVANALRATRAAQEAARRHGFAMRAGLAFGPVSFGTIGTNRRRAFTVYGDTVNRAARLEDAARNGNRVLMDEACAQRVEAREAGHFDLAGLGETACFAPASEFAQAAASERGAQSSGSKEGTVAPAL